MHVFYDTVLILIVFDARCVKIVIYPTFYNVLLDNLSDRCAIGAVNFDRNIGSSEILNILVSPDLNIEWTPIGLSPGIQGYRFHVERVIGPLFLKYSVQPGERRGFVNVRLELL